MNRFALPRTILILLASCFMLSPQEVFRPYRPPVEYRPRIRESPAGGNGTNPAGRELGAPDPGGFTTNTSGRRTTAAWDWICFAPSSGSEV
jgi:hypothetical protein